MTDVKSIFYKKEASHCSIWETKCQLEEQIAQMEQEGIVYPRL